MAKTVYLFSPFGIGHHPWLNNPDTKYNADGIYKVNHEPSPEDAAAMAEKIEQASKEAFDAFMEDPEGGQKLTPAERKKWQLYLPFTKEEDPETGDPTGRVFFHYKQNAKIKIRATGEVKDIKIGIKDSKNKDIKKPVFSGAEMRVMYSMRPIKVAADKRFGVRLDFCAVQVRKMAPSNFTGGFSEVEGFEEDEGGSFPSDQTEKTTADTNDGGEY